MSRPRIVFCYRYGLLGGVSAQLLNRYPYLSREYDVSILYESDYGMATRFPAGVARVTPDEAAIVAALREIQPDITVVIDSPVFLDAWRSAGGAGRLVLEVHTTTANLTYLHHRDLLEGVTHIVTVSSYMEKLLGTYGLADLAPVTVVPNCLDDRWRQPAPSEQLDGAPVLWVGKLDGHKRWRRAVDIMDELVLTERDIRVRPIVVGGLTANNVEIQALTTRLATSPGLADAVWLPRVEYDRMPALYTSVGRSGGLHLCTTSNESFGMAVAESLVCGCPVVAPAVGALPELLPPAALYRPGDWAEARDKARRALSDAGYRQELLSTASQVRELTTPERVLEAYRGVVSAVLSSQPAVVRGPEPAEPVEQIVLPAAEPAQADPAKAEPATVEPATVEPATVEPVSANGMAVAPTSPASAAPVPAQAVPNQETPAQPVPASTVPAQVVAGQADTADGSPAHANAAPAQEVAAVPAPSVVVDAIPAQPVPAQPVPAQPVPAESVSAPAESASAPAEATAAARAAVSTAPRPAAPVPAQATPARTVPSADTAVARAPFVVASVVSRELGSEPVWLDAALVPGEVYRLRAITEGGSATDEKAAVLFFEGAEGPVEGGRGLVVSPTLGPHIAFATGSGAQLTDRLFTVVNPVRRVGLKLAERGPVTVRTLSIEKVTDPDRPVDFFLSFDVEALPERATSDHIDRLVWGKVDGGEYGIRRICDVLAQYGLKGNFMLDYASCTREGERAMREIIDFLAGRGHEIHLHLHAEWLVRWWGSHLDPPLYLDGSTYPMARRMIEYTMRRHVEFTGEPPRVFRAGGYRVNPDFILAAGALGIEALTNIRYGMLVPDVDAGGDVVDAREPFVWENGIVEIPVDLSPDPLSESFEKFLGRFDIVARRKQTERTFNVVMHSWSLMRRNEAGHHDAFDPSHEERLSQMCELIVQHGRARGYAEYLDQRHLARPTVRLSRITVAPPEPNVHFEGIDAATCNVCDAVFARAAMVAGVCPSCEARVHHRRIRHVLDTYGNVFDGRTVLACGATATERYAFLRGAAKVVTFDSQPGSGIDLHMDIEHMANVPDQSYDGFYAVHVLSQVKDDARAVAEVARVLRPGGAFLSTVPGEADGPAVGAAASADGSTADIGDGGGRRYAVEDYVRLLSPWFDVSVMPGTDPVTGAVGYVFLAYRRPSDEE